MPLESLVEGKVVRWAKSLGGIPAKFVMPNRRGAPDRLLFMPGGVVLIVELKRPGGRRRPHQIKMIEELQKLGHKAFFADSLDQVKARYKELLSG